MALQRHKHWETRAFHQFLKARARAPFCWGTNDCALFAADAIEAMTGVDIAAEFRGQYTDEAGACAAIKRIAAGTTVADAAGHCAAKHGMAERRHPLMAQRGDLVIMQNPGATGNAALIAGVMHLNGRHAVSVAQAGPVRLEITNVVRSWRYV